ncbi:MAG TPA: M20/M25/M40 family metallo-hydrolase [Sphingomicrobium sp.]|nr:M20/M25/M40 family metallo-hydrolase [Sphingomicrobium sp.]
MTIRIVALGLAAAMLLGAAPPPNSEEAAAQRVRGHVEFLASDLLEGRETGSKGLEIGAAYVASQFRALGLEPGGANGGWFLAVPLRRATQAGQPSITYVVNGRAQTLTPGRDANIRPSLTERSRSGEAGLVFVGHGISEPAIGIDNYAGLDVRGKIVVAIEGTPEGLPTEIAAHLDDSKIEEAGRKGAAGFIEIPTGRADQVSRQGRAILDWVGPDGRAGVTRDRPRFTVGLSTEWQERLFAGAKRSLQSIQRDARQGRRLAGFPLAGSFRLSAQSSWQDFTSPQTIAVLRGSDPALANEYVVMMGHIDHLGIKEDARPGEDRIYNGAVDNAAGVATLIEAARTFVSSGKPPRRSVIFMVNTGEERGLLGADYFAANPTVPASQILGVVDLDMPLLLYNFTDVVAFGADHSTVAQAVADAGRSMGIAVSPDPMPEQALFVRSDHYRFVLRGIPGILLMTGYANGGKDIWSRFWSTIYHKPNDDLSQPLNWRAGARYGELNYRIARNLADADRRPNWYGGDYFANRFAPGQPRAGRRP